VSGADPICPRSNRRVRKLYLPLGGRHFWSRRAYELAYASQRETKYDRALRHSQDTRMDFRFRWKSGRAADITTMSEFGTPSGHSLGLNSRTSVSCQRSGELLMQ
jgi:hypothetical protein